jgi:hypothetical protein
VVKKRTPPRKSSAKKRVKKAARPARKAAGAKAKAAAPGGVNFNPVKKQLRAHIAELEAKLGGPEARAAAVDKTPFETLDKLKAVNRQLTDLCQPTMVIGS